MRLKPAHRGIDRRLRTWRPGSFGIMTGGYLAGRNHRRGCRPSFVYPFCLPTRRKEGLCVRAFQRRALRDDVSPEYAEARLRWNGFMKRDVFDDILFLAPCQCYWESDWCPARCGGWIDKILWPSSHAPCDNQRQDTKELALHAWILSQQMIEDEEIREKFIIPVRLKKQTDLRCNSGEDWKPFSHRWKGFISRKE